MTARRGSHDADFVGIEVEGLSRVVCLCVRHIEFRFEFLCENGRRESDRQPQDDMRAQKLDCLMQGQRALWVNVEECG